MISKYKGRRNIIMANTSPIFVRIDSNVKAKSEAILNDLGVSMSSAIFMFLMQVIMHNGIPFDVRIPDKPIATGNMTDEEIAELVQEGVDSCKDGTYTLEEVDEMLKKI